MPSSKSNKKSNTKSAKPEKTLKPIRRPGTGLRVVTSSKKIKNKQA